MSLLTAYLVARGRPLPPVSQWGGIAAARVPDARLGNGGVVFAEQWVPSGLAAVLVATAPFWMAAVEALPAGRRTAAPFGRCGLVVGFSGIVLLVWPDLTLGVEQRQSRASSRESWRCRLRRSGGRLGRRIRSVTAARRGGRIESVDGMDEVLGTTAFQMLAGGLMMTAVGTLRGEWAALFFTTRTTVALFYLATIGAIGGFVAYTYALRHLPVSFVSLYAYINPVIAVALGVLVLHEPFTWRMAIAAGARICRRGGRAAGAASGQAHRAVNCSAPASCTRREKRRLSDSRTISVAAIHEGPRRLIHPRRRCLIALRRSSDPAPADQPHQEQHDRNDQQHVNEVAHGVAADQARAATERSE